MLYLRPIEPEDAAILTKWINDDETNFGSNLRDTPVSVAYVRNRIEKGMYNCDSLRFFIIVNEGVLIGITTLSFTNFANRSTEAGIVIGEKEYKNSSYTREAIYALADYCFDVLGLNSIYTTSLEYNRVSVVMQARMGFTHEGVLRQSQYRFGKYWDRHFFSVLRDEWYEYKLKKDLF